MQSTGTCSHNWVTFGTVCQNTSTNAFDCSPNYTTKYLYAFVYWHVAFGLRFNFLFTSIIFLFTEKNRIQDWKILEFFILLLCFVVRARFERAKFIKFFPSYILVLSVLFLVIFVKFFSNIFFYVGILNF